MIKRLSQICLVLFLMYAGCNPKPKTELYLERGLDILSNKKIVDFEFIDEIVVKEIGVVRDKKENKKTLIFKMGNGVSKDKLALYKIRMVAEIKGKGKTKTKTVKKWDFKPTMFRVNETNYIIREIRVKEDRIRKLSVFLYHLDDREKTPAGSTLTIKNLYTYND